MRIGIVGPPFIAVPPLRYGGTELFIANLARGLHARGHQVTVYANGDSRLPCTVKSRYEHTDWPVRDSARSDLKNLDHVSWAIHDASRTSDLVHLNDVAGVPFSRWVDAPVVVTLHHPHEDVLSEQYARYPEIDYVAIADWLARHETMPRLHVVHHGIPINDYTCSSDKDDYVAFLGRIAPCKGPHLAIEAARRAGIRLKLAGEIQPIFQEYWNTRVAPYVDGCQIEYVGEADLAQKVRLLSRARALLFPIQWDEPFGLVMVEAMACGTPVIAFPGGAVAEIVQNGINGWICADIAEMASRIIGDLPGSVACRESVVRQFNIELMVDRYLSIYEQLVPGKARATAEATKRHGRRDSGTRSVLHPSDGLESDRANCGPSA